MKVAPKNRSWLLDTTSVKPITRGGEANIYEVPGAADYIAKLYHKPTNEHAVKLKAMLLNPPDQSSGVHGRPMVAWPTEILITTTNPSSFAGFVMPRIMGAKEVFEVYVPQSRLKFCTGFNYKYLMRTARNISSAVHSLHEKGYVIGDINERNVLVSPDALITIIDVDSFQVRDDQGFVHRCLVGTEE